ncbi:hypothetical protein CSQ89_05565 [Chitinimonas sp. BJB300]|nr:hypothetical protein CSQ89_05565 [Chitinimonas sp. BJB300]
MQIIPSYWRLNILRVFVKFSGNKQLQPEIIHRRNDEHLTNPTYLLFYRLGTLIAFKNHRDFPFQITCTFL